MILKIGNTSMFSEDEGDSSEDMSSDESLRCVCIHISSNFQAFAFMTDLYQIAVAQYKYIFSQLP